ncbi:DDE_Tnp_1_7 domain-containing protein [Trichonephila clavipes]|nr:DDE_Tnp_1_7 domain-containing protein [Trichonephila clavipes]
MCYESITSGSCMHGRISEHNVFKGKCGPISYGRHNIENGYAISSWRLLIGDLDTFISILYARGIYDTNNLELHSLVCCLGSPFFRDTMARDLLSSLHPTVDIDNNLPKMLPGTISFYNSTKFGVDIADQMVRKYSVKAGPRRWPVHVFYNIMDLEGISSWILYEKVTEEETYEDRISLTTHWRVL